LVRNAFNSAVKSTFITTDADRHAGEIDFPTSDDDPQGRESLFGVGIGA
jgi:hypothetical protein